MNASKASIMITIFFSTGQGKNHYTVSSVSAIQENLSKFHKINIQRRWIFYCLRYLLDEGFIRRKERYRKDGNGLITQIPSMITMTLKGVAWLVSRGISGAKKIYQSMMQYLKKQDKRFPGRKDFDDGSWKPADPEFRKWLENKCEIVTKKIN